jgi:hypothetical protein
MNTIAQLHTQAGNGAGRVAVGDIFGISNHSSSNVDRCQLSFRIKQDYHSEDRTQQCLSDY